MECKVCKYKCKWQSDLDKHNGTEIHLLRVEKLEFQKKLEEANLETLKEKELSVKREQKLKEANLETLKVLKEKEHVQAQPEELYSPFVELQLQIRYAT
jgi:hypothetical protein